ncbi:MAG TPA: heme-binding protein [Steroidobacteraceae bacterium]|nr:heme-binding protein [Steroidobacteraceae bacterium]
MTRTIRMSLLTAAALAVLSATAFSQQQKADSPATRTGAKGMALGQVRPMTVALAKRIVTAARTAACAPPAGECSGAFAVTDDAGVLLYLEVIDGVLAGGPDLAIKKAKTSAVWRRPTETFQDAVKSGRNTSYADGSFSDMTTSPGGVPIFKDGRVVGGFGVAAVGSLAASKQISAAVSAEVEKIFGKQ